MSKWIYGYQEKTFWNLDKVVKIKINADMARIELLYDNEGEQWIEYNCPKKFESALNGLFEKLG